jgi:hypothetical protein
MEPTAKATVYIKSLETGEIVDTVDVKLPCSEKIQEKLVLEILRTVDTDRFFVDDSEIDAARHGT